MAWDDAVRAYFAGLTGEVSEIAEALRQRIGEIGPHLRVSIAHGHPCWSGNARVVSIVAYGSHCNLQLWSGASLAEDFARIAGTGKAMRHVKLRRLADLDEGIDDIIEAAIQLDGVDPVRVR